MTPIKVLVVEDEILIAETIRMYLIERGHKVTDIAISYDEAVTSIENNPPDVVLLDVRLYGKESGIDFANYLISNKYNVPFVFLTSQFDKRIVESAMTTNPNGYLTKPIQKESLWTTTELAFNQFDDEEQSDQNLHINDGTKTHVIDPNDILYIISDHVYINIHLKELKTITVRNSLASFIEELDNKSFIQCHRSYGINVKNVDSFDLNHVKIKNVEIPLSRSRKYEVIELLKFAKAN